jgi:WD40 repeat protein
LVAVGGNDGRVEFWDGDQKQKAYEMFPLTEEQEITSIAFEPKNGLQVAIGTEKGKVFLYDMRYPVPIYSLTHHYRMPI